MLGSRRTDNSTFSINNRVSLITLVHTSEVGVLVCPHRRLPSIIHVLAIPIVKSLNTPMKNTKLVACRIDANILVQLNHHKPGLHGLSMDLSFFEGMMLWVNGSKCAHVLSSRVELICKRHSKTQRQHFSRRIVSQGKQIAQVAATGSDEGSLSLSTVPPVIWD
jgi:hypothetical protein